MTLDHKTQAFYFFICCISLKLTFASHLLAQTPFRADDDNKNSNNSDNSNNNDLPYFYRIAFSVNVLLLSLRVLLI